MRRLLSLLILFALAVTNGPAIAGAICQHADAMAHAAALDSDDADIAAAAAVEERMAAASDKKGALADAAAVQLVGFVTPDAPELLVPLASSSKADRAVNDRAPTSIEFRPPLEPPLA